MVGEDASFLEVVHKSLVESGDDGREFYFVATVGEDFFESFNLLVAVGEDENFVTIVKETGERITDDIKILVVNALWRTLKINGNGRWVGRAGGSRE